MKYIKKFENEKKLPKVGDYILIKSKYVEGVFNEFFKYNIGIVVRKGYLYWKVKFNNIPQHLKSRKLKNEFKSDEESKIYNKCTWTIYEDEIIDFSENKEDLEMKLTANKYNL